MVNALLIPSSRFDDKVYRSSGVLRAGAAGEHWVSTNLILLYCTCLQYMDYSVLDYGNNRVLQRMDIV